MKIGIISDSHTKVAKAENAVRMLQEKGADFFIHAGDIVDPGTLDVLEECGKKYIAVYGNNDAHLAEFHNRYHLVQEPYYFKLANTKFKLMHLPFYMSADSQVVIFGHTHKFKTEFVNGVLFINPGEICARSKPLSECVLLEVLDDEFIVQYYTQGKNDDDYVLNEAFSFQRQK